MSRIKILDKKQNADFIFRNDLFLYQKRLVVPDEENLRTRLIKEAHDQLLTVYSGRNKTHRLLRPRYFWPSMLADIERYIKNCYFCHRTDISRDKISGFLKSLSISDYFWQHVIIDFKSMPLSKKDYNMVFIIVNRFSK
jgi:hypothetical protein